jgi:hypothetical protein
MNPQNYYKYQHEKEEDHAEFVRGKSCLKIKNSDYNGPGGTFSIFINPIKEKGNAITSSIGVTFKDDDQLKTLSHVLNCIDSDQEIGRIIRTPRESIFFGNTKKEKSDYMVEISKIVITSSGRTRHGLFIMLTKQDMKKIHNMILDAIMPLEKKR